VAAAKVVKRKRLTERQMICKEAKLLHKMMRPSRDEQRSRMRRLRLTDSTRLGCHKVDEEH
jgi:hypothetical protein